MDLLERSHNTRQRHPWERARFRFFKDLLAEAGVENDVVDALDIGAGDAWFAAQFAASLRPESTIACFDPGYAAESDLPTTLPPRVQLHAALPARPFDLVLLLDVLEHVEQDADYLKQIVETNLKPGGMLLASVPAWQSLFSEHDRYLLHHRRYHPRAAKRLLQSAGLIILRNGGLFHSLLLPRKLERVLETRVECGSNAGKQGSGHWKHGKHVTRAVAAALRVDNELSKLFSHLGIDIPGLSWWALCKKP